MLIFCLKKKIYKEKASIFTIQNFMLIITLCLAIHFVY